MNKWQVQYDEDFVTEVETYPEEVRIKITAMALVLEQFGPTLSRPKADTLKGSKYPNMKELRFAVGRQAIESRPWLRFDCLIASARPTFLSAAILFTAPVISLTVASE
jgi:hypothetical protein